VFRYWTASAADPLCQKSCQFTEIAKSEMIPFGKFSVTGRKIPTPGQSAYGRLRSGQHCQIPESFRAFDDFISHVVIKQSYYFRARMKKSGIVELGSESVVSPDTMLAIYPSFQKYEESRRLPFVTLADRLRRSLAIPETVVVTSGE